jgi:uncharacterized membrane protein (DUF106 family)
MTINRSTIIKFYYLLIVIVVITQATTTVVKLAKNLSDQHKLSNLKIQKNELLKEQEDIEKKLGEINCLTTNQVALNTDFNQINQPVVISADHVIAWR